MTRSELYFKKINPVELCGMISKAERRQAEKGVKKPRKSS